MRRAACLALVATLGAAAPARAQRDSLETFADRAVRLHGDSVSAHWHQFGRDLFDAERYREAIAAFERALQLGAADRRTLRLAVAEAYERLGDRKQAGRWGNGGQTVGRSDGRTVE